MVQMDAAPVSTAAVASSRPREHREAALQHGTDHNREGGLYNDFQVRDPIAWDSLRILCERRSRVFKVNKELYSTILPLGPRPSLSFTALSTAREMNDKA